MTSPDGITWTPQTAAANIFWRSVTYGGSLFVAVAYDGAGNRVMTSPDGVNWTLRAAAANNGWYSVTYGGGLFVAVSTSGAGNRVMTSPDGVTWTIGASAANNSWSSVTYGGGLFVAVSDDGHPNQVMTSGTSSGGSGTSSTPTPWAPTQQVGLPATGSCTDVDASQLTWGASILGGWKQSWAMWANKGTGGPVCTRDLDYNTSTGTWSPA